MNYLLLVLSAILNGTKSVCAKIGNRHVNETQNIYTYNLYMFLTALVISVAIGIPSWNGLSTKTLILGSFYGLFIYFAQFFLNKAIGEGNTSISTLFYSCGFLGPTVFSVFKYGEDVTVFQIIGILLILSSFVITVDGKGKTTSKWFICIFAALLCNASCGITQKLFAMSEVRNEQSGFMITTFGVAAALALIFAPKRLRLPSSAFLKTALLSGLALGALNTLNVYLAKKLPGSIVFPCVNSGGIISSAILAWLLLKEKLSGKKIVGIIIGIAAIFIIALL